MTAASLYSRDAAATREPPHAGCAIDPALPSGTFEHLVRLHAEWGDIYRVSMQRAAADTYVVAHPLFAQEVLATRYADYERVILDGRMSIVLGNRLLTSRGELWKAQRKLLQPYFHGATPRRLVAAMAACNTQLADRWRARAAAGAAIELTAEMLALSREYNLHSLLSEDAAALAGDIGVEFLDRLTAPIRADIRSNLLFVKQVKSVRARITALIAERRARAGRRFDLLQLFIQARHRANDEPMQDPQIVDEIFALLTAGHETVATALKSVWYLLALHPAVQQEMRREIVRVTGGAAPSVDHLDALANTRAAIQEAMRIYPPIWVISRKAIVATQIGEYPVPRDSTVFVCPYLIHRHPEFWPDPGRFDPGRFAGAAAAVRHNIAYLPYSRGARSCIGDELSMLEMLMHVATMAARFELTHIGGEPGQWAAGFALRSPTPIHVRLRAVT